MPPTSSAAAPSKETPSLPSIPASTRLRSSSAGLSFMTPQPLTGIKQISRTRERIPARDSNNFTMAFKTSGRIIIHSS
ncbi:hypothetical protein GC101_05615 [Paenibacillus sp. LMG 31459]|uniref:Uncharacterized protein n=1 Tax=Paenibacillus phytohabitans TaxID=2654978 RepID=A0ABX1YC49_9BACL|nr:hypothetical protein [Paenibacillus phytohabitans]